MQCVQIETRRPEPELSVARVAKPVLAVHDAVTASCADANERLDDSGQISHKSRYEAAVVKRYRRSSGRKGGWRKDIVRVKFIAIVKTVIPIQKAERRFLP